MRTCGENMSALVAASIAYRQDASIPCEIFSDKCRHAILPLLRREVGVPYRFEDEVG